MNINPNIFIYFDNQNIVLWDYLNHRQFHIDMAHLEKIIEYLTTQIDPDDSIQTNNLIQNDVISKEPYSKNKWSWDILARIFHTGTSNLSFDITPKNRKEWADVYLKSCKLTLSKPSPKLRFEEEDLSNPIHVPYPSQESIELHEAFTSRKTVREFEDRGLEKLKLGTILYYGLGYLREREASLDEHIPSDMRHRRSSPSGGGLNSIEGYLYIRNVDGIDPRIYYYNPLNHTLHKLGTTPPSLGDLMSGQHFIDNIAFGVFLTCRFDRMWWKYYHSRAYRVALMEAGHISQSLQLLATNEGLQTWISGAFSDDLVSKAIDLRNEFENPLLFVGAGYSQGNTFSKELDELLNNHQDKRNGLKEQY
ncbi:SagB family peptide dehydrogenase [Metapseudomonas resinovorans]|uniref:SagB family peptide dehydrogenase n=1 Tax=Metapseudomonas resinovorans TaxID=53412 RepID=UPI0009DB9F44|nr:SagB family peptide dehydrogenase [Pseudomonas resinovorans]